MSENQKMEIEIPVSPVQQGMFFHYLHERNKNYLEQLICDIGGELDIPRFERTLNKLIETHETLRTLFHQKDGQMQQVILRRKLVQLDIRDISDTTAPMEYIDRCIRFESDKHFDLSKETCRSILFKIAKDNYVFLCTYHHLILDSWTIRILEEDFCKLYLADAGGEPFKQELYPYRLYVDWIDQQDKTISTKFWANYLARFKQETITDSTDINPIRHRVTSDICLGKQAINLIEQVSQLCKSTANTVFLAAWGIFLLDHYNKDELIFGCITHGRMINLKNVDKIAGLFVNAIPLHIQKNAVVNHILSDLQRDTLISGSHAYLSFSDIMASGNLRPKHVCTFVNFSIDSTEINNTYSGQLPFKVTNIRYNEQANYDIYLDIFLTNNRSILRIHYDQENHHFDSDSIRCKMIKILEALRSNPQETAGNIVNQLVNNEDMDNDAMFNF